jgi:2-polyprenyl-6-hydroxyphenyl methylase/3-demethylubiquinone-9 3-methyltransferase
LEQNQQQRFAFGENWRSFLERLDEERIERATESLATRLQVGTLAGKRFLDIGCGSGLFSLAAYRLGAAVVSIDYDADSVVCTEELRDRFGDSSERWQVMRGSVLDEPFMQRQGTFDIVYSWGVLHHTGEMRRAIQLAAERTEPDGLLFISIYNDQGPASRRWGKIKRGYHALPGWLRPLWVTVIAGYYESKFAVSRVFRGKNPLPFEDWRAKKADRGMSAWHDWVDWVGGWPFEVSTPEEIIDPLERQGFELQFQRRVGKGWGCNEYVFRRNAGRP